MSSTIAKDSVVTMHYTLTDDNGTVLDSSKEKDPLAYLHGAGNIIPGLESALEGKNAGEQLKVRIEAADAYGEAKPELVDKVPLSAFGDIEKLEEGMMFQIQGPDGQPAPLTIRKVEGDEVTVDANHPLAGVPLNFDVNIVEIREATKEEVEHGHVH